MMRGLVYLLKGDGKGSFTNAPIAKSGFYVSGDARSAVRVMTKNKKESYIITQNQDSLLLFDEK
jgi:enediyne biosynthesis protein E4